MSPKILISVLVVCMVVYGLFEARRLAEGPSIAITSPKNGIGVGKTALIIHGIAKNVAFLTINDKPAFTDEKGNFSLTLSPPPGYTVVTVASVDRFGRRASASVTVTMLDYCPVV